MVGEGASGGFSKFFGDEFAGLVFEVDFEFSLVVDFLWEVFVVLGKHGAVVAGDEGVGVDNLTGVAIDEPEATGGVAGFELVFGEEFGGFVFEGFDDADVTDVEGSLVVLFEERFGSDGMFGG